MRINLQLVISKATQAYMKLKHLKFWVLLFYAVHPKMNLKCTVNVVQKNLKSKLKLIQPISKSVNSNSNVQIEDAELRFEIRKLYLNLYHGFQFTSAPTI
jgi:hypothetical protein